MSRSLALGGPNHRPRVIHNRIESSQVEDVGFGADRPDGRQRLFEVFERLRVALAELVEQLVWRYAHVFDRCPPSRTRNDALSGETLEHRVHLRRRDPRQPAQLVAVLGATLKQPRYSRAS